MPDRKVAASWYAARIRRAALSPAAQHLVAKQSDLALTWIKDADCTIDPAYQVAPCLSRSWPRE